MKVIGHQEWYKRSLILLISIIFGSEILNAQLPLYRQFTEEDGLPSNTTYQVFEDKKGYLYITTAKGICRFDGAEFIKIPMPDLQSEDIPIAAMDDDGKLWAANLAGELVCVEGLSYKRITLEKYPEKNNIKGLSIKGTSLIVDFIDSKFVNHIITISYNRLNLKFEKIIQSYRKFHIGSLIGMNVNIKSFDLLIKDINLLIIKNIPKLDLPKKNLKTFPNAIFDSDKFAYRKNYNKSLNKFSVQNNFLNLKNIGKIFFIDSSQIILCKNEKSNNKEVYIQYINNPNKNKQILNSIDINSVLINEQNLYIFSTNNNGILFIPNPLFHIGSFNYKYDKDIKCLSKKSSNIIGYLNNYIIFKNSIDKSNIASFHEIKNTKSLNYLLESMIIGNNMGLYQYRKNKFTEITNFSSIKSILQIDENNIYISLNYGVEFFQRLQKDSWQKKTIYTLRTYALNQRNDTILLGTTKGLYGYYNDSTFAFKGFKKFEIYITKLYVDKNNTIWICTDGKGLIEYKNENDIKYYDLKDGMPSLNCSDIVQIDENKYAVGTDKGLWIYDKKTKFSFMLNKLDGLKSNEITALLNDGENLWVGTTKEIIKCNINELKPNPEIPYIEIIKKEYEQDGKYYALSDKVNYDHNRIIFEISSRSLLAGKIRKYFYRVIGIDTNWIETSDKRIELLGLKSGEYKFEVKVYNEDGIPCDSPATFSFTILPPWWRTLWFYSVILLISSGGIYWWVQRVKKQEAMKFAVQNQINEYRQQALQSQMNPHFIFNSLNAIQSFLSTNDEKNAMQYLSKFGKLIRLIFEQSKTKLISIEEEIEMLRNYLELEKLRFKGKVEVILNVEKEVLSQDRDILIPPLMIQPIIENSFRHGLFHKGSGGKLEVMFSIENNKLKCIVRDNGIGRSKSKEINKWREATHKSSGLTTTIDRIRLLDNNEGRMSIVINDLKDDEDNPIGTETILKF